jgi:hypothetical protein
VIPEGTERNTASIGGPTTVRKILEHSRLADRVLTLTTQRENLRAALEDVEADPAFPKLCVRLRKRIADLLETT